MSEETVKARSEWLVLAAILIVLAGLRFSLESGRGPYGVDGSYYVQIARNLMEGRGLTTSVSLYHQGLDPLPAPTNIYPLWPVLLGGAGWLIGLPAAVHHLPRILYLAALGVLYFVARNISPGHQRVAGPLNVSHLCVVLMGLTPVFFNSTTFPYTEGLAFTMAGAALLTSFRRSPLAALSGGVLAALATLTRSQMLMLVGALIAARAFGALRDGRWRELVLSIAGAGAVLVSWLAYVSSFVGTFALHNLYVSYHQTPSIEPYPLNVQTSGWKETTLLRLEGLATSLNPASEHSFVALFGVAALLVPLAVVHWIWRNGRPSPRQLAEGVVAVVIAGALLSFMLVLLPQRFFRPWLFGWRHGLPFIFLLLPSLVELIGNGRLLIRRAALLILSASIVWGGVHTVRTVAAGPPGGPSRAESLLLDWIDARPEGTVVLTSNAQTLSAYSAANFRWTTCDDTEAAIESILTNVRTDYVLIYERERPCSFAAAAEKLARPELVFGESPGRILVLRNERSQAGSSRR